MKDRSGPFDLEHNFTIITIVINSTNVIIINVYILWFVNIVINCCDLVCIIFIVLFVDIIIPNVTGIKINIFFIIFLLLMFCWLGEEAVKYANITNIPPT